MTDKGLAAVITATFWTVFIASMLMGVVLGLTVSAWWYCLWFLTLFMFIFYINTEE